MIKTNYMERVKRMKWFPKMMFLLLMCLYMPCVAMAFSQEEAVPIKGGNSYEGAAILTEAKYAKLWSDEVWDPNGKQYYMVTAPKSGTYHINFAINTPGEIIVEAKWENKYNAARGVISDKGMLSFEAQEGEVVYICTQPSVISNGGKYVFSVCFDGFHAPSVEAEIAHYATCSAEGEIIYPCTLCGQPGKSEPIPKVPHTLGDWQTERNPGCTTTGMNVQRCTVCGEIINQQEIPAFGHGSTSQVVTKPATCLETGILEHQCEICRETLSKESIPYTDHARSKVKTVRAATCTAEGRDEQRCSICNALLGEVTLSPLGHSMSEWITTVEATKTAEGLRKRICVECGYTETEVIEKLPWF